MRTTVTGRGGPGRGFGAPRLIALVSSLALLLGACSGTGAQPSGPDGSAGAGGATIDAVYGQLSGVSGEARTSKLVELANEEGDLSIYTSNAQMQDFANDFQDAFEEAGLDINVSVIIGPSDTILQRLLQEHQASFAGADVVELHAPQNIALTQEGVLANIKGPVVEALPGDLYFNTWAVSRMTAYAVAWNTDLLGENDRPKTYEELADPKWAGKMVVDPRLFGWFQALWEYFRTEKGWTDEQNEEYWRAIGRNAAQVPDTATGVALMSTGDKSIYPGAQYLEVSQQRDKGASVDLLPIVEPLVIQPTGMSIVASATSPAAAQLFAEWYLTEAAPTLSEQYRLPPNELGPGGPLEGVKYTLVNTEAISGDDGKEWAERYADMLGGGG